MFFSMRLSALFVLSPSILTFPASFLRKTLRFSFSSPRPPIRTVHSLPPSPSPLVLPPLDEIRLVSMGWISSLPSGPACDTSFILFSDRLRFRLPFPYLDMMDVLPLGFALYSHLVTEPSFALILPADLANPLKTIFPPSPRPPLVAPRSIKASLMPPLSFFPSLCLPSSQVPNLLLRTYSTKRFYTPLRKFRAFRNLTENLRSRLRIKCDRPSWQVSLGASPLCNPLVLCHGNVDRYLEAVLPFPSLFDPLARLDIA